MRQLLRGVSCRAEIIPWVTEIQEVVEEEVKARQSGFQEAEAQVAAMPPESLPGAPVQAIA
jgi:hypothetical protein